MSFAIRIVAALILLGISLGLLRLSSRSDSAPLRLKTGGHINREACPGRPAGLKDLDLNFPIKYARRDVIVKPSPHLNRTSLTKIEASLLPEVQVVDPANFPDWELEQCSPPLTLEVPAFPRQPVSAAHIFFGISTHINRIDGSIPHLQRSLAHTNARLIILAIEDGEFTPRRKEMAALEARMHEVGIDATVVGAPKGSTMQARYFSLVKILYGKRDSATQWISLLDDDTFLPSMHSLVDTLSTYDSSKEWYLGSLSEDWWSVMVYGMMSFGGGGTFLSLPMAARINDNHETCEKETNANQGDIRIFECITRQQQNFSQYSDSTKQISAVTSLVSMKAGAYRSHYITGRRGGISSSSLNKKRRTLTPWRRCILYPTSAATASCNDGNLARTGF